MPDAQKLRERVQGYLVALTAVADEYATIPREVPERALLERLWALQLYAANTVSEVAVFAGNAVGESAERVVWDKYLGYVLDQAISDIPSLIDDIEREAAALEKRGSTSFDITSCREAAARYRTQVLPLRDDQTFTRWLQGVRETAPQARHPGSLRALGEWIVDHARNRQQASTSSEVIDRALLFQVAALELAGETFQSMNPRLVARGGSEGDGRAGTS
jgi:hypothetical protein